MCNDNDNDVDDDNDAYANVVGVVIQARKLMTMQLACTIIG